MELCSKFTSFMTVKEQIINTIMKKGKSLFIVLIAITLGCYAQPQVQPEGYRIEINIKGMENKKVMMAYYFNESTYTKDTATISPEGQVVFEDSVKLNPGVYIMVLTEEKQKMFDFAVYDDQHFTLTTDSSDFYRKMTVDGDINNQLFFENLVFNGSQNELANPLGEILSDSSASQAEKDKAKKEIEAINQKVVEFQQDIIDDHPNSLVAKILLARKKFEFPEHLEEVSEENRDERYYFYKQHFWDNIDLTDEALLRLPFPLLQQKVDEYFDRVVVQDSDSIINEMEKMIDVLKVNDEMYKYFVWSFTSKFYAPAVMGLDQVFVHLNDKYFASGEMNYWADEQLLNNVKDRAEKLRLSMIGMKAPDLRMLDADLRARSVLDIRSKYTVIYFYDPDCGHCKEETPKLVDFANSTPLDLQVFSVCADTSLVKMKGYISDMGMEKWVNVNGPRSMTGHYQESYDAFQTPTLYLLNEKKEIIAKKLPADRLKEFLDRYEEQKNDE